MDTFEAECCALVVGKAADEVRLSQIGPDLWSLFTIHSAGNARFGPRLPNRMLAYRVRDAAGNATLVLANAVNPDLEKDQPFKALRALSAELGAPIRYIINPGSEHHMTLGLYAEAFPDARVCVGAGRVERENPALCAMDNVEMLAHGDALPELSSQGLHVHVWDGFMEGNIMNRSQGRFSAKRGTAEPLVFWHEASNSLLNGGHGWFYWAAADKQPWLVQKVMRLKRGQVTWSPFHYTIHDAARCAASAERVLDWKFDRWLDLHAGQDQRIDSGAHDIVRGLLRPVLEQDWDALPFGVEPLEIPEGTVTGGDWKTYR